MLLLELVVQLVLPMRLLQVQQRALLHLLLLLQKQVLPCVLWQPRVKLLHRALLLLLHLRLLLLQQKMLN